MINPLLHAIAAKFATAPLSAAFGSLWADAAPEGTSMPYVVYAVSSAPTNLRFGPAVQRSDVRINFTAYGEGRDVLVGLVDSTLLPAFDDVTLQLGSGTHNDTQRTAEPIPRSMGRDASAVDGAGLGEVWAITVPYTFSVSP